jgi:hypothetical protein
MDGMDKGNVYEYVESFNAAVRSGDFAGLLAGFSDDAIIRFENVPGAGVLEYAGRNAYTAAYANQPPDDEIEVAGAVREDGAVVEVPFRWRSTGDPGTMRLTVRGDRISAMLVRFGPT